MNLRGILSFLFILLVIAGYAQIQSDFSINDDSWTVYDNSSPTVPITPTYNPTGGNPSGNISFSTSSTQATRYYFQAPAKFLGNLSTSYNQTLNFDMMVSLVGTDNTTSDVMFASPSVTLVYQLPTKPANASTWLPYSIPFNETNAAWHVGNQTGAAPTKDQMKQMLSNITSIRIRLKFTTANAGFPFIGSLDNVKLNIPATVVAPAVTAISPMAGIPNLTTITITGNNFNSTAAQNVVFFGGVKATVTSASSTQLNVKVPKGALFGRITVLDLSTGRSAQSTKDFSPLYDNNKDFGGRIIPASMGARVDISFGNSDTGYFSVGDLDGDGLNDFIVNEDNANQFSVWRNAGLLGTISTSSFDAKVSFSYTNGSKGESLIYDFDGDGKLDVALGNQDAFQSHIALYRNTSTPGVISFAAAQYMNASSYADGPLYAADIDGDGRPEILSTFDNSAGGASAYFTIFQNLSTPGDIEFAAFQDFDFGIINQSTLINTGDLDGDGKLDVVLASGLDSEIYLLQNSSTPGSFSFNTPFLLSGVPNGVHGVALADLDNDGKIDLSWGHESAGSIYISKNISSAGTLSATSFATPFSIVSPVSGSTHGQLIAADINADSKLDLIFPGIANIAVFENVSSTGTLNATSFLPGIPYAGHTNNNYYSTPIAADFDGDGKLDIAVGETSFSASGSVSFFHNECFPVPVISSLSPASASAGDVVTITGDLMQTGIVIPSVIVRDGGFKTTSTTSSTNTTTATIPLSAKTDQFSVTSHGLTAYSKVLPIVFPTTHVINSTSFTSAATYNLFGNESYNIVVADWDDDGKSDVAIVDNFHTGNIYQNTHATAGQPITNASLTKITTTFSTNTALTTLDIDGDGKLDIFSGYGLFQNASTPGTISFPTAPSGTSLTNSFTVAAVGDYNNDGKTDLATIVGNTSISLIENRNTNGAFSNTSVFATFPSALPTLTRPASNGSIASADFDGDGSTDIVTANPSTNNLSYYRNLTVRGPLTATSFGTRVDVATGTTPDGIVALDFDGDGKPDIATAHFGSLFVNVYRNTSVAGSISFAAPIAFPCATKGYDMIAQDLDGDGKPEMIVIHQGPGSFSIFQNKSTSGNLSFATAVNYPLTHIPIELAASDINLDNKPDLIFVAQSTDVLMVYQNRIPSVTLTITQQPANSAVCSNSVATFTTAASGTTNIMYQWQYSSDGIAPYADIANGNGYANVGTAVLSVNTAGSFGAGYYRCKVNGDFVSTVFTNSAILTVTAIPSAPTTIGASSCTSSVLTLTASGGTNGNYLWYSVASGGTAIAGQVNNTFTTPVLAATTSYYVSVVNSTCESARTIVTGTINTPPNAPTTTGASGCTSAAITLTASGGTNGQYRWYSVATGGTAITGQVNNTFTTPMLAATTIYYVSIDNGTCESARTNVTATIQSCASNQPPVIAPTTVEAPVEGKVTVSLTALISDPDNNIDLSTLKVILQPISGATATIDGQRNLILDYTGITFSGTEKLTIQVCDLLGACAQKELAIDVVGDIVVYNGVSPNNDGKNDVLTIQFIDVFDSTKKNHPAIYNRWGDMIFDIADYDNVNHVFRGLNNNGNEIPSGTYFYKIEFASGKNSLSGYLEVKR